MNNRCHAITTKGEQCKLRSVGDDKLCHRHSKIVKNNGSIILIKDNGINLNIIKDNEINLNIIKKVKINDNDNQIIQKRKPGIRNRKQENRTYNQFDYSKYYGDYMFDDELDEYLLAIYESNKTNSGKTNPGEIKSNKLQQTQSKPNISSLNIEPQEILIPMDPTLEYECQCCFTEFPYVDLIKCSNASTKYKHVYCKDCIQGYIESGINDKKATCQCMSDTKDESCKGCYSEEDIAKCLPEQTFKNFRDMSIVSTTTSFAKLFDNYKICPFCNMYGIIAEPDIKYIQCGRCVNKSWCVTCKRNAHGNEPCWKIRDENDVDGIVHTVTEIITNALAHKCPKCGSEYIKEEGCNLITCSACHSYSCYLCGMLIKPRGTEKYWHFYGEGGEPTKEKTCKLFNDTGIVNKLRDQGNSKFNNAKVISACRALLNANTPAVQTKMMVEMKKHGVDLTNGTFNNKAKPAKPVVTANNNDDQNKQEKGGIFNGCIIS